MKIKKQSKLYVWQLKAREGGLCEKCGRTDRLTVDHRIPQSLLQQLGLIDEVYEWEENFSLLCRSCNSYKASRIDITDPKAVDLIQQAVQKLTKTNELKNNDLNPNLGSPR